MLVVVVVVVVAVAAVAAVAVGTCDTADMCNMMADDMVDVVVVHTKNDRAQLVALVREQYSHCSFAHLYRQRYHAMFRKIHENYDVSVV